MLHITVPAKETWDEDKEEFIYSKEHELMLEHSLISISKWESRWHVPYLRQTKKTKEQILDYIKCMSIKDVPDEVYYCLTDENIEEIFNYIDDKHTAYFFISDRINGTSSGGMTPELITSDVLYYKMFSYGIPKECEKWHLNRLMTLIRIFGDREKRSGGKMSPRSNYSAYAQHNAIRQANRMARSIHK